jgi:hypothetical protein
MMKILSRYFFLLFVFLFSNYTFSQTVRQPKLVVNIVIDGLRSDYISLLWDDFDEGGFKRLIQSGAYAKRMSYPYMNVGRFADYATIMSGTVPAVHGITANNCWDTILQQPYSILRDPVCEGINTAEKYSPKSLECSTLSDEIRLWSGGKGKTCAIGINPESTILLAGHGGKAVWLDPFSAQWATSSYFGTILPSWAMNFNLEGQIKEYMQDDWVNLLPQVFYKTQSYKNPSSTFFVYKLGKLSGYEQAKLFLQSPFANSAVIDLSLRALNDEYLGVDDDTDLLNLQLTVRGEGMVSAAGLTAEMQDMYYRLDKDLKRFMDEVDELCSLGDVLYVVTASQEEYVSPEYLKQYGIPTGYFVGDRSMSLLGTYLMAIYGQVDFFVGYSNGQLYLNREEIRLAGLDFDDVAQKVAEFMRRFEGVQTAFTAKDMEQITNDDEFVRRAKLAFRYDKGGDVLVFLKPGWVDVPKEEVKIGRSSRMNNFAPLIISGWKIAPQTITSSVSVLDITPTLCSLLELPFPNANLQKGIWLTLKEK